MILALPFGGGFYFNHNSFIPIRIFLALKKRALAAVLEEPTEAMIVEILEGLIGGGLGYFALKVLDKILIDRAAETVEETIVKPALEFVRTTEFWDDLDDLVDEIGLSNATKCILIAFGVNDGVADAMGYVTENYSIEKHRQKIGTDLTNYISTED